MVCVGSCGIKKFETIEKGFEFTLLSALEVSMLFTTSLNAIHMIGQLGFFSNG